MEIQKWWMMVLLVSQLFPTVMPQNVNAKSDQAESTGKEIQREQCETQVISESVVIVNCSDSDVERQDFDISKIDSRVTTLDMSSAKLTSDIIFQDACILNSLLHLNLSNNELIELRYLNNAKLEKLKHLDLSKNKVRQMPYCGNTLMTLKLDFNEITMLDVTSVLKTCGSLQKLSVTGNSIDMLFSSCNDTENYNTKLEYLDLSFNRLKLLDKCFLKQHHELVYLNVSYNSIAHVSDGLFKTCTQLEKLDLSHNEIEYIAADSFEMLQELKYLDLSFNKLQTIPSFLPMTDWFDVSFNRISTLPESFSAALYPQAVFFMGGNPFLCNCDLLWLKEFFDTRKYLLKYLKHVARNRFIPVCASPLNLKGVEWDILADADFECSGFEEKERQVIKENVEQVLAGKELIEASEVGENFIIVKWTIPPDLTSSVELTYHKFGKKKEKKEIILPSTVTSYRIKKLKSGTPYVICLTVTLTKELQDCIEIVTEVTEGARMWTDMGLFFQNLLHVCWNRIDIIVLLLGLITVLYYFFLRELDDK